MIVEVKDCVAGVAIAGTDCTPVVASRTVSVPPGWIPGLFSFSKRDRDDAWVAAGVINSANRIAHDGAQVFEVRW